jgi:Domain of unknown function (DUF4388)
MARSAPQLMKPGNPMERGFVARLKGESLIDLIQMECLRGTRQTIRVTSTNARGYLYFDRGQVVHAICGSKKGEDAVYEMLLWADGAFEVCDIGWPDQETIHVSWQFMLMESIRRADEVSRDSEPPSQEVELMPEETEANRYGVIRAVRFEEDGQIVSHLGAMGDLADVGSYALRLARIVGNDLGLGAFVGLESRRDDTTLFLFLDEDTIVAVEAEPNANLSAYRQKAGL